MRRSARVDANQKEIIGAFRVLGCSVVPLHTVGHGCPDIAVGKNKKTILVEIKDGSKPPSARKLTSDEQQFHEQWKGSIAIVESLADVKLLVSYLTCECDKIRLTNKP